MKRFCLIGLSASVIAAAAVGVGTGRMPVSAYAEEIVETSSAAETDGETKPEEVISEEEETTSAENSPAEEETASAEDLPSQEEDDSQESASDTSSLGGTAEEAAAASTELPADASTEAEALPEEEEAEAEEDETELTREEMIADFLEEYKAELSRMEDYLAENDCGNAYIILQQVVESYSSQDAGTVTAVTSKEAGSSLALRKAEIAGISTGKNAVEEAAAADIQEDTETADIDHRDLAEEALKVTYGEKYPNILILLENPEKLLGTVPAPVYNDLD